VRFENKSIFNYIRKNAPAYRKSAVVVVNSEVVGLALASIFIFTLAVPQQILTELGKFGGRFLNCSQSGLPDFSWYIIPNRKNVQKTQNVPNGHKISQISVKYSKRP
jgi:hypothetical protein